MIKLHFLLNAPLSTIPDAKAALERINIPVEEGQEPLMAWIIAMHSMNNIPYVPGQIDINILQEIESNPDVLDFFEKLGGSIIDEEEYGREE